MNKNRLSLKEIYSNQAYEVQLKAPIFQVLLIILFAANPPTILRNLASKNYVSLLFSLVLTIVYGVSLVMLYRGKFKTAADVSIILTAFLIITQTLLGKVTSELYFLTNSYVGVMIVLLSVIFISTRKKMLIVIFGYSGLYIIDVIHRIITNTVITTNTTISTQVTGGIILYVICSVMLFKFRGIVIKSMDRAEEQTQIQMVKAQKLKSLASKSQDQIAKSSDIQNYVEETAATVYEIENNVKSIRNLMGNMLRQFGVSEESLKIIAENVTRLDTISSDQSANITETSASLEEMVASIKNVNNIIATKSEAVRSLQTTASNGLKVISTTDNSFKQVSIHIDSIKQMLSLITSIASRTNLLAMNAAIEAAHAGDSGKGFAVVADEIRKLAESSSLNVKQISETIKELLKAIETMGQDVQKSGYSFSTIDREVDDVDKAMHEINSSVNELSVGSDEILRATTMMNDLTVEVVDSIKTLRENDEKVGKNIESLGQMVTTLSQSMDEISSGTVIIREEMEKLTKMSQDMKEFNAILNRDIENI